MNTAPAGFWAALPLGRDVRLLTQDANGLAAFDKPAGILSHPNQPGDQPRSLLTCRYAEAEQCYTWQDAAGAPHRLWLLNRLDSATSGVILAAASEPLARLVRTLFAKKQVRKTYQALVFGTPPRRKETWHDQLAVQKKGGVVRTRTVGNIPSLTECRLVRHTQGTFSLSLIELEPKTGRSHQLRVQCAKRGLPIVGDQTYGDFDRNRTFAKTTGTKRLFLHSASISLTYELAGRKTAFRAEAFLPGEFETVY